MRAYGTIACLASLLALSPNAHAAYFKGNWKDGSGLLMQDLRWPFMASGTYFSFWNGSFCPVGGSYYGGVVTRGPGEDINAPQNRNHGTPWTFWGSPHYRGDTPRAIYVSEWTYPSGAGGEGSACSAGGRAPFLRRNAWFTMCRRVWSPLEGADEFRYDGWWIKDIERNTWHLKGVIRIPAPVTGYKGTSTFVEALAPAHLRRMIDVRRSYCRLNGEWHSVDKMHLSNKYQARFTTIENNTVFHFDSAIKHKADPKGSTTWTVDQPEEPRLDKPGMEKVEAFAVGKQLAVSWAIPRGAAPQLGYRIEAFSRSDARGKLLGVKAERLPFITLKTVDLGGAPASVRITITDVFDRTISTVAAVNRPALMTGGPFSRSASPGLRYEYFEAHGKDDLQGIPDFDAWVKRGKESQRYPEQPIRTGFLPTFDDRVREGRQDQYAIRYTGNLKVPVTGLYVFDLRTHDGSVLRLGDKVIAGKDRRQSATVQRHLAALEKGQHPFELSYFKSKGRYRADRMEITWEGPGFSRRPFEPSDLALTDIPDMPSMKLAVSAAAGGRRGNRVDIPVQVNARGHKISRVDVYWGELMLATANAAPYALKNVQLPAGDGEVWARLVFDGKYTMDSERVAVSAKDQIDDGPWKRKTFGELGRPFGISSRETADGSSVSVVGEGVWFRYQAIKGDFSLTGRISGLSRSTKENGVERGNWIGFYVKARMDSSGSPEMNRYFGIFRTAGRGMRGTAAWPDLGGQRLGEHEIKTDHDWLRVDRRGSRFSAYISADAKEWTKVREHITNWGPETFLGVTFRSQPHKNRTWPRAGMDHIKLESDTAAPDTERATPKPEDLKLTRGRVIAAVQSLYSSDTFYARSSGGGVLKSADGGDSWKPVNGSLTSKDAMMARSVAVHPKNPSIVLRGGGYPKDGKLRSGLWKSVDGGRSWKLVTREIDFDGSGPSTLFGEVISFNPIDPNMVSAGGESTGIFTSFDAGDTWAYGCQKGERISCLQHNIAKDGLLLAGTFPDSEFEALGMGKPSVLLPKQEYGKILMGNRSGTRPVRVSRRVQAKHFGVMNLAFDVPKWGFLHCATTRGLYYTYNLGGIFQRHVHLPFDTPYSALGSSLRLTKPNAKGKTASKVYAAPLSTDDGGPVYATTRWGRIWSKTASTPRSPGPLNAGISGITCDVSDLQTILLCNRNGILKSSDGGKSYTLVYRSAGAR